ncbi:MAG: glycosyltransferase family 2 protein, partial [Pseudoflavonifractor sp.]
MERPFVSIIVPIYKVEPYLRRCVDSILAQTHTDFELILVDDGSPDGCPAICDAYAAQDSRVRVIHQKNGGLSAARNAGLDVMRGQYVAFCDSDDVLHPDYLKVLYGLLTETGSDIAQCGYCTIPEDGVPDPQGVPPSPQYQCYTGREMCGFLPPRDTALRGTHTAWNKLYAAALFADIRYPVGRVYEDTATTYRLHWAARKVVCTRSPYYYYRIRLGSITNSAVSFACMDQITALRERADFFAAQSEA